MRPRERLMATLRGEAVDRPAVCFYEINGLDEDLDDPDPFNVHNHPSWRPLVELARERTDRIVMRGVLFDGVLPDPLEGLAEVETRLEGGSRIVQQTVRAADRVLLARTRRDPEVNTVWHLEHLLKGPEDLRAFLELPQPEPGAAPDTSVVLRAERELGDGGIVMIDTPDPLCLAASLFDFGELTILAMTQPELLHRLLERFAATLLPRTEALARALPGRLWRIYGPEYASPPYMSPAMFRDFVVRYDRPMVEAIQRHGGFARIHSHGRLRDILDDIASTGCTGLDPIEPPPQGDVELKWIRERHGRQMVLFGNLEVSDIEGLPTAEFEKRIDRALREGTAGEGRGFVLMPSACPCGREVSALTLANYEKMVELVERFA